ncbi:MAG TPA: hypothetical protein PKA28_10980 [Methylomusa anaerophila]|uniref:Uncharacterized protein n=1 Tax=Methylomusa anaerophila TaxID=1930071 RepID=A0A348AJ34_9FIRM|nr:hypothetical protein [Methylomusa anaerophila]BBB91082.1 hypothetical protein MAMMFC1_01750 [Methylomusa anaerophila]HML88959.1 hypothetical protein [Methylomusa anaerophila]
MVENIANAVQRLADNLELKTNYDEELEKLGQYESDAEVLRYLSTTPLGKVKINLVLERINDIRKWIKGEIAYHAK